MQAKFMLFQCTSDGKKVNYGTFYKFDSLDACFDFLAAQGHRIESAELINRANVSGSEIDGVKPARDLSVLYQDRTDFSALPRFTLIENVSLYRIQQIEGGPNVPFDEFSKMRDKWSKWNIARKIFHPGNSLTLAFLLIGVGLVLGAPCPPALIFVALGVAAFSAVSALVYGARWLSRDYNIYKAKVAAKDPPSEPSILDYLSEYPNRLKEWAGNHKIQAIVMGIGFALFVTGLVVTALAFTGGLAAVPILAGVIGYMGASGTALGAVGAVFGGALGSSAIATTLASIFAGATLILAPVNILDTIRRFVSGGYEHKDRLTVVPPQHIIPPPPPEVEENLELEENPDPAEQQEEPDYGSVLYPSDEESDEESEGEKVHETTKKSQPSS